MDPGLIERVRVRRNDERGFTLIEMMIVVAVIAVLAAVVVPAFFKSSQKAKASTEIAAMFAEIQVKEEQFKSDSSTGAYSALATCPTAVSQAGALVTSCQSNADWTALRMSPSLEKLRCTYTVTAGLATDTGTPPTGMTFVSPTSTSWYFITAICDNDNDNAVDATYFASSVDSTIQKLNEGN
jgi:prepilin-type N-terminal cleavage/methylation domain-containing protein